MLRECYKNGIYLVLAEITPDYSKYKNRYAFLYNGDFVKEKGTEFFGYLLDNRRTSPLRGLEKVDVADKDACRKSINTFFRGRTEILRIYRVYDAKNMQKHEIVQKNIRTSNKRAKKEMKNETDVSDVLGSCEITPCNQQYETTQSNQEMN